MHDLRRQLAEERLARSLGVPVSGDFSTEQEAEDAAAEAMADAVDIYPLSQLPSLS